VSEINQVSSLEAPAAIGPYSQAIRCGDFLFMSGQIPLDPATGRFAGDTISIQTEQVMKNLKAVLVAAGATFEQVVKTTVYLSDMNNFVAFNEIYGSHFKAPFPARATVQVARLPKDALVEIDAVVYLPR
jgi:2-iminobutanoate/2-iminopropanoate deaminase